MSRRAVWLAAVLLLGACAPQFTPPRLSVIEVHLVSAELWEQHLKLRLRVENPNARSLPVRGLEYTLEVEGEAFASGASAASFVVPAAGEAEFDMDVTTNLAGTVLKLIGRGPEALQSVSYHLSGRVSLATGLMRTIPFDQRGSFSLQ